MAGPAGVPVWDRAVRVTHWAVAGLVLFDYFGDDSGGPLHRNLGYLAAALVLLRLAWAVVAPGAARFADWWPTPSRLRAHLVALRAGRPERRLGHNPLGALMMLALWALILALALTGWLSRLDAFWGGDGIPLAGATFRVTRVQTLDAFSGQSRRVGDGGDAGGPGGVTPA